MKGCRTLLLNHNEMSKTLRDLHFSNVGVQISGALPYRCSPPRARVAIPCDKFLADRDPLSVRDLRLCQDFESPWAARPSGGGAGAWSPLDI